MKKFWLASTAAAALIGGSADAADMAVPGPVYRPLPVVTYFTWSGCYVGGNGGYAWNNGNTHYDDPNTTADPQF